MRSTRIWAQLLGVAGTMIEKVELTDKREMVVSGAARSATARALRHLRSSLPRL